MALASALHGKYAVPRRIISAIVRQAFYQFSAPFVECARELQYFRMSAKFFAEFPELKADIQVADPQPEPSSVDFNRDLDGFSMAAPQGMDSLPTGFLEGDGFPQMDWSGNQANMRVGEV